MAPRNSTWSSSSSSSSSSHHDIDKAYALAVERLSKDMPMIQHGSGDVHPSEVLPSTSKLLAVLTTQYVSKLVDAALDAQSMLCDASQPQVLPPPRFPRHRAPPIPPPLLAASESSHRKGSRATKPGDEFWGEPVVPNVVHPTNSNPSDASGGDLSSNKDRKRPTPSVEEWVGVAGVDLLENARARAAYVRGPHALSTHSFLFSVCHDVYAYGKVLEVQAAKRSLEPLLADPIVAELVRTEGRATQMKKMKKRKKTDDLEEEEDEEEEEEDAGDADANDGPAWPGLEHILPVHGGNSASETAGSDEG